MTGFLNSGVIDVFSIFAAKLYQNLQICKRSGI
jgi:hypothetical protein